MKVFLIVSSVLGAILLAFGWWGTKTEAGRQKYDEMAGMLPLGAYYLGILLLVIFVSTLLYSLYSK